jgi:hypothetical protein
MSLLESLERDLVKGLGEASEKLSTPDPVDWIEKNFYIPETKNDPILRGRIELEQYHRDVIREALSKDEKGFYKYSIIIWSDIKKSIKSTIAAAVNLFIMEYTEWGEQYIVANDLKQADSRVSMYLRRCLEINPKFKKKYGVKGYRTTHPANGSYAEAIPIDPSGEAGSNADMITFCLDEQTEVLTKDGWKGWETLSMNDLIATRSRDGVFEWQEPDGIYCSRYTGEMYKITNRSLDALVTPDHRMYGKFIGGRGIAPGMNRCWKHEFVDNLESRFLVASSAAKTLAYYPVLTSLWPDGDAAPFIIPPTYSQQGKGNNLIFPINQTKKVVSAELFAEFMGWYLSEGCVIKKRGRLEGISIGQSKTKNPENYNRIIELLKEMDLSPRTWSDGMSVIVYHSKLAEMLLKYGLSGDKYVPTEIKELPLHYLMIFLNAYIKGDGHRNGKYGWTIGSKSREMRDDLVEIAQKCGFSVSSYETQDFRWIGNPKMYCLYLRSKDSFKRCKVERKQWSTVSYDGVVFCPSTPNGIIYVRRNGTYYWTGNSELWGANQQAQQRMWGEMTLSPTKAGKSFRWVESYAGYTEESLLLYSLYALGTQQGKLLWPDKLYPVTGGAPTPLELYVNEEAKMLCLWNTQPRCKWQTPEYYRSEEKILLPSDFRRMHRNQWVSSTETFLPMEWFDACRRSNESWPEVDKKHNSFIIALDAATTNDNFGLFLGCRHPKCPNDVLTILAQKWVPVNGKIDFQGTEEKPGPELVLRRLVKEYNVIEVAYDPTQLYDMCNRLYKEGLAWFRPFNQGQARLIADSQLRDLVREKHFWHRGESDLREHFNNANAQIDSEEHKIRIVKRVENLKIDLCVAASMCCHELLRLNL